MFHNLTVKTVFFSTKEATGIIKASDKHEVLVRIWEAHCAFHTGHFWIFLCLSLFFWRSWFCNYMSCEWQKKRFSKFLIWSSCLTESSLTSWKAMHMGPKQGQWLLHNLSYGMRFTDTLCTHSTFYLIKGLLSHAYIWHLSVNHIAVSSWQSGTEIYQG